MTACLTTDSCLLQLLVLVLLLSEIQARAYLCIARRLAAALMLHYTAISLLTWPGE